jgi:2-polyprenyl-3-methyl-5-hydroxy-6-metoxy-1,4-benzoquinol methylase
MNDTTERAKKVWRPCPVCGHEGGDPHWVKGALRVVRCPRCGMLFASPVEAPFIHGTIYDQLAGPYYLTPAKLESDYAPVRFTRELRLLRRFCPEGAVLDVGCSTGAFLHHLTTRQPGRYSGVGIDIAGQALDYAASRGVTVARTPFLEHDFGGQQFDAVTFWAVLEHLAEPHPFLAKAGTLLKPGGLCFVLVPNVRSLATRLLGLRYRYIMAEHLNYFTADTLKRLAARDHGWSVVALRSTHFNPVVIWQDWRRVRERVPDAERARLLKKTTAWKQSPFLAPVRLVYWAVERCLGRMRLADNLVMVLRRH